MKVAPVSADLLIKLGIGVAVLGLGYFVVRKGIDSIKGALDTITGAPGRVLDATVEAVKEVGVGWQHQYQEKTPEMQILTGKKYEGPLVNDDGMDFSPFGGLSG